MYALVRLWVYYCFCVLDIDYLVFHTMSMNQARFYIYQQLLSCSYTDHDLYSMRWCKFYNFLHGFLLDNRYNSCCTSNNNQHGHNEPGLCYLHNLNFD